MDEHIGFGGWTIIVVAIILGILAYNHYTSKIIEKNYGYKVESKGITEQPDCSSIAPQNLYDSDSGHWAGYEWGASGKSCGGNSDSFIEGCQEYHSQESAYEYCLNRNSH